MRAGESRRRALAHLLRSLNQIEEETLVETRAGYQIVVRIEIIADGGEIARVHLIHADSREIELRARHGQHDVDKVIDEERGDQYEANLLEPLETLHEIIHHHDEHHRIIEEVPHVERLAEPYRRAMLAELHRGLAPEHRLLVAGEDMVEVREKAVELERVGIPVCQKAHLHHHTDKRRQAARKRLIKINQRKGQRHDARPFQQHRARMVHARIQQQYQKAGQRIIYQADGLYRKQPLPTLYPFE